MNNPVATRPARPAAPAATPEEVWLPGPLVEQILRHAAGTPDREVCGLVSGLEGHAQRVYPIGNVAEDPANRYLMDPAEQIRAMKHMRETGTELFAIYHSHPQGPPRPSATDVALAAYPEAVYLIVSLATPQQLEIRAFRIVDERVTPVILRIE